MTDIERVMQIIEHLERRIDLHESKLEPLVTVPATLQLLDRRLWESDKLMRDLGLKIEANTAITNSIREAQIAGKALNNAGKWLGSLIIGAGAVWAAIKGFK